MRVVHRHVTEESLRHLLTLEASQPEVRAIVRHLLPGCPRCAELAQRLAAESLRSRAGAPVRQPRYDEVLERVIGYAAAEEQRLAAERLESGGQWTYLETLVPEERFAVVEGDPSFHTYGFFERLLHASRCTMRTQPAAAVDVARLAVLVSEHLDPDRFGSRRVADFRATAWATLGNVKRLAADFEGARAALDEAWRILEEEGTFDPLEQAHLIGLNASYLNDVGELETAEAMLEEALEIYRRAGDAHLQGRTLLKMGDIIGRVDPARGIAHIRKGLALVDLAREPRLELSAQHDLAWFLNDSGRPHEALRVLERARPLYAQLDDPYTRLRRRWLEARIAARMGEREAAESVFRQLWDECRAQALDHELVMVSIDLAEVLAEREPARAVELVAQCYPIMLRWGLHRHALAAWLLFQRALIQQRAGTVFGQLREYYVRNWAGSAAAPSP